MTSAKMSAIDALKIMNLRFDAPPFSGSVCLIFRSSSRLAFLLSLPVFGTVPVWPERAGVYLDITVFSLQRVMLGMEPGGNAVMRAFVLRDFSGSSLASRKQSGPLMPADATGEY